MSCFASFLLGRDQRVAFTSGSQRCQLRFGTRGDGVPMGRCGRIECSRQAIARMPAKPSFRGRCADIAQETANCMDRGERPYSPHRFAACPASRWENGRQGFLASGGQVDPTVAQSCSNLYHSADQRDIEIASAESARSIVSAGEIQGCMAIVRRPASAEFARVPMPCSSGARTL